jgi:hypothetical protein
MTALSLFPARVKIARPDGTMTPEFYRALQALFERVGGSIGDMGADVFAPFLQTGMESVLGASPEAVTQQAQQTPELAAIQQPTIASEDQGPLIAQPTPYTNGTGLNLLDYQFSLADTAVTAAAYGTASSVGQFTVDAQGRLTAAANVTISIAHTQVTGGLNFTGDIAAYVSGKTTTIENGIWISVV